MSAFTSKNAFSAIAPNDQAADQPAGAVPSVDAPGQGNMAEVGDEEDLYVPETQTARAHATEPVTTREEIDIASSNESPRAAVPVPVSPPRIAGQIHGRELTPSGGQAQAQDRLAEHAQANQARWANQGGVHARTRQELEERIANTNYGDPHACAPPGLAEYIASMPLIPPNEDYGGGFVSARTAHRERPPHLAQFLDVPSTSLPSRPSGAPRTARGLKKHPQNLHTLAEASAAIESARQQIRAEPLGEYMRRQPLYPRANFRGAQRDVSPTRSSTSFTHHVDMNAGPPYPFAQPQRQQRSPTPGPSIPAAQAPYPFAQPQHQPRSPTLGPYVPAGQGAARVPFPQNQHADPMDLSDHGDPADDVFGSVGDNEPLVPRPTAVPTQKPPMTERILNTARRIAAELGHSSVPVDAYGSPTPIDGLARNGHLVGVPQEAMDFFVNKEGGNVIFELYAINGRRAFNFSTDDQINHMHHLLDCLFLEDFPDHRIMLSLLCTPPGQGSRNSPRARSCLLMGHGLHPRQEEILRALRFWTVANTNFMTHGVVEERSTYVTSFSGVRCEDLPEVTTLVKSLTRSAPAVREFFSSKLEEEDPALVTEIVNHIATNCLRVEQRKTRPSGQLGDIIQYSVFADVNGVVDINDLGAFELALRRTVIWHIEHGLANYLTWCCRTCHAISHDEKACDAHVHLKWPILNNPTNGRGAPQPPAQGPGPQGLRRGHA